VTRHRHTGSEIVAKLATADDMAARGALHRDIAKSLGISVMTYHRWRKSRDGFASTLQLAADSRRTEIPNGRETTGRIRELRLENSRLRRLVADLLLEKVELQESRQGIFANHRMVERS
jgi:putative transposase